MSFRFDPIKHEYWSDDEKMPSVTGIIGGLNDFSMIPPKILKRKGELGTEFHRIISLHLQDDLVYDSIDERLVPAFDSFLEWSAPRLKEFRSGLYEQQLYSKKLWLAGTCDLALPAELFDWKLRFYKPVIDILQLDGIMTLYSERRKKEKMDCLFRYEIWKNECKQIGAFSSSCNIYEYVKKLSRF